MTPPSIRVIAICLFQHNGSILVAEGIDSVKDERFARPLGGGIEPGEASREAIIREIREETGQEITDLRLLGVLENLFTYEGKSCHEIVFVYDGSFADTALPARDEIPMVEEGSHGIAKWRPLNSFGEHCRLVPQGLMNLLKERPWAFSLIS